MSNLQAPFLEGSFSGRRLEVLWKKLTPSGLFLLVMIITAIPSKASPKKPIPHAMNITVDNFINLPGAFSSFTVMGTVRNARSGEIIEGIKMEVYLEGEDGKKSLAFNGDFKFGRIYVVLSRSFTYQLIIYGPGYEAIDLLLDPQNIPSEETVVRYDFFLKEETMQNTTLIPYIPQQQDAVQPDASAITETISNQISHPSGYSPEKVPKDPERYRLKESTSFRKGPGAKTGVIVRLRPGNEVKVLEKNDKWWWRVEFQGKTGYVKAHLLERFQ